MSILKRYEFFRHFDPKLIDKHQFNYSNTIVCRKLKFHFGGLDWVFLSVSFLFCLLDFIFAAQSWSQFLFIKLKNNN